MKKKVSLIVLVFAVLLCVVFCGNRAGGRQSSVTQGTVSKAVLFAPYKPCSPDEPVLDQTDEAELPESELLPSEVPTPEAEAEPTSDAITIAIPQIETHIHDWQPVYTTIQIDEIGHYETVVVQAAYDEPVYTYQTQCSACGRGFTDADDAANHILDAHDGMASYTTVSILSEVIHHEALTEQRWVVDQPQHSEQVLDHYQCACGATK